MQLRSPLCRRGLWKQESVRRPRWSGWCAATPGCSHPAGAKPSTKCRSHGSGLSWLGLVAWQHLVPCGPAWLEAAGWQELLCSGAQHRHGCSLGTLTLHQPWTGTLSEVSTSCWLPAVVLLTGQRCQPPEHCCTSLLCRHHSLLHAARQDGPRAFQKLSLFIKQNKSLKHWGAGEGRSLGFFPCLGSI